MELSLLERLEVAAVQGEEEEEEKEEEEGRLD